MIVNLSIPTPVIVPPRYFRVRYRVQGTTPWTTAPNQDNDPFTLDLPVGEYEIEFTLVNADGTLCPSVVQNITVVETEEPGESPCPDEVTAAVVKDGRGYALEITYVAPTMQPCGHKLLITPQGAAQYGQTYYPLPPSPIRITPVPNVTHDVQLIAILCNGTEIPCEDLSVPPATTLCDPAVLDNVAIIYAGSSYQLRFTFTQSSPYTPNFQINYSQIDVVTQGVPDPGGSVLLAAGPSTTTLLQPIQPNFYSSIPRVTYQGNFIDGCGVPHKWEAFLELT